MLDPVDLQPQGRMAIAAWNWLNNGSNAIDWAGLPYVVALLGVHDLDRLLHDLMTIKAHAADQHERTPAATPTTE